ncbi:MAG: glyoxylate/hydroxypyruvate reductase A [Rhizobiaceae bacterium]
MTQLIPFSSCLSAAETKDWLNHLNRNLTNVKVVRLKDLSEADRTKAECAIVANANPADLETLPNLKWIQSLWAGVERLIAEYTNQDVTIVRLIDTQMSKSMSEAALAWTLFIHRSIPQYRRLQAQRLWKGLEFVLPQDRTVGVLGLGELGKKVALRLAENDFNTVGWSRSKTIIEGVKTYSGMGQLSDVLSQSDIIIVLLPQSAQTIGLLSTEQFAQAKLGASVINFGRGRIINDTALLEALDSGHLYHAVLDVFAVEPLPSAHPYWTHPSVTVLPHCSAPTNKPTAAKTVAANITAFLENGAIPDGVDRSTGY